VAPSKAAAAAVDAGSSSASMSSFKKRSTACVHGLCLSPFQHVHLQALPFSPCARRHQRRLEEVPALFAPLSALGPMPLTVPGGPPQSMPTNSACGTEHHRLAHHRCCCCCCCCLPAFVSEPAWPLSGSSHGAWNAAGGHAYNWLGIQG
jgi:hypothetical protein